ncbi:MAG: hypothetical protein HZB26_19450 [Candidatus Hydrogenedentes bacterium]|nr:hypothetical protein [Candidatus Hydrogenedentota bacterium]
MTTYQVLDAEPRTHFSLGGHVARTLCPVCHRRVFSFSASRIRLKTRILIFDGGNAYAKCRYCKHDVIVPLVLLDSNAGEWSSIWTESLAEESK